MVTYQADSPSRMCDGSLDEAARMVDRSFQYLAYAYPCLTQAAIPTSKHIDSPSGLVWRTVLRPHTSASSVLPSPLRTRMSLHHLTPSHISPLSCLMYSASAVSSLKRQAWGIRQALCSLPATHPECISLSPHDASMQTQAAGHREPHAAKVVGMSHYGSQCAHTDDTAAPSPSGHSISTLH
jgi:hypothetical protein